MAVFAHGETESASASLIVEVDASGVARFTYGPEQPAEEGESVIAAGSAAGSWWAVGNYFILGRHLSPPACEDGENETPGYRESDQHAWYFNGSTTPAELTVSEAVTALREGTKDVTQEQNDCGRSDTVDARASYEGTINRRADMDSDGNCASFVTRDGVNVVDFGNLPDNVVGLTCTWYRVWPDWWDEVTESDMRLNKADFTWTVTPGSGCSGATYDVESIAAHERGHTFGLDDVSYHYHGNLTMAAVSNPCSKYLRTLGAGDMDGLEYIY